MRINFPAERSVYQRDASGYATLTISGSYSRPIDKVEIKAVAVYPGQGIDQDWTTLSDQPGGGVFSGSLRLIGGWYTLLVRGMRGGVEVSQAAVSRTGVGEVFLIAGQSNAQGLRDSYYGAPASDDRVNYISNNENTQNSLLDPVPPTFSQLGERNVSINPRGQGAWCWGSLGDKLVKRLNVPVLFINAAWDGTAIRNWAESAQNVPTYNYYGGFAYPEGMPYSNLAISARHYVHTFGLRSILWIQGETDTYPAYTSRNTYRENLQFLINKLSQDTGKRITWTIARTSRTSTNYLPSGSITSSEVIAGQNDVLNTTFNPVYPGPETDGLANPRTDGIHFLSEASLNILAEAWNNVMNTNYFATITPNTPTATPQVTVSCASNNNALSLTLPQGFSSYRWITGATGRTLNVTAPGSYYAVLKDAQGNASVSNIVQVTSIRPQRPAVLPAGNQQTCEGIDFEYSVQGNDAYSWFRDGAGQAFTSGSSIKVSAAGSYTVRAQNVFGCASETSSASQLTVQPAPSKPLISAAGPFSLLASVEEQHLPVVYEWFHNDQVIPSANQPVYKVNGLQNGESGNYSARSKVTFTIPGNTSPLTCVSEKSDPFSYTWDAREDIVAFPNPGTSGNIFVESRETLNQVTISLYNLNGILVSSQYYDQLGQRERINSTLLPRGVYLLQIENPGWKEVKRIVIY